MDSLKIAGLLRGGLVPQAYTCPRRIRATLDLMRRRNHFMGKKAELFAYIQNTASQYNHQEGLGRIARPKMELVVKIWLLNADPKGRVFFVNRFFRP